MSQQPSPEFSQQSIAVIGMALRLPGATSPDAFWDNVVRGVCSVRRFEAGEGDVPAELQDHPDYVPVYGSVPGAQEFDADLFGYSPREAQLTDPQQRKFLECAYEALESAGYGVQPPGTTVGVVAGTGSNTYQVNNVLPHVALQRDAGDTAMLIAAEKDHVATRTAHRLDLHGPALTVQTSCSTSLVAVHVAVQMLQTGEADIMLAGGSTVQAPQEAGHVYTPHGVGSPDGLCRTFDERAAGTVFGSGVGVVVLKPLDRALADGDRVRAVIAGTAINNDGSRKVGYTAPSVAGQVDVLRTAHRRAGVGAASIGYLETHGTGTELGDAIEVEAIRTAFAPEVTDAAAAESAVGDGADHAAPCVLGTLKPNIGHSDIAAGVAALIKAVLVLENATFPPSINVARVNPELQLDGTRFEVCTTARPWERAGSTPRRAGVSSFGLGGTNAHVVLEEAPVGDRHPATSVPLPRPVVLPVSARTAEAAGLAARAIATRVADDEALDVGDVAHTLQHGRRPHPWRTVAVGTSHVELSRGLRSGPARKARRSATVTYAFSGFGGQWSGMLDGVVDHFPVVAEAVEECISLVRDLAGYDLAGLWLPDGEDRVAGLAQGQPALFTAQVAIARLLTSWGLAPASVLGHSLGEYAAACTAGALTTEDALRLVLARAAIFEEVPEGAMTAVLASRAEVEALSGGDLDVAAVNAEGSLVVSGSLAAVAAFEAAATRRGVKVRRLPIGVAGHSAMLDPLLPRFAEVAAQVDHRPFEVPMISTLTAGTVRKGERLDADYWTRHLRHTVEFAGAAQLAAQARNALVLEIGAGHALTHLVQQIAADQPDRPVVATSTLPSRSEALEEGLTPVTALLQAAGEAWTSGATVAWEGVQDPTGRRRVTLPAYPFARERHWLEPASVSPAETAAAPVPTTVVPAPDQVLRSLTGPGGSTDSAAPAAGHDSAESVMEVVHRIWVDLLGREVVGSDANFFALGGDSLRLVRLIARLREELAVTIPLRQLAGSPTVGFIVDYVIRVRHEEHTHVD